METYANQVSGYLLTQSWQIALLAVIVSLIAFVLRNRSAHIRYLLWLIVLAKCLVPPIYSVPVAVLPERIPVEHSLHTEIPLMPIENTTLNETSEPVAIEKTPQPHRRQFTVPSMKQTIVLVWLAGIVLFLMWVGSRAVRYTLWLHRRRTPLTLALDRQFRELFAGFRFRKLPKIWLTSDIAQPFVWGLFRGSVYLPADFTGLDKSQHHRTVLVHELSHVARFDAAVNALQILAQAIFWFHPFVWWVNKKIRQEREKCCDEMSVVHLSAPPEHYTDAIVDALAAERRSAHPVPSLAIVGSVKDIEERIKTMLRPGKKFYKRPSFKIAIILILLAVLIVPISCTLTHRAKTEFTSETATEPEGKVSKSLVEAAMDGDLNEVIRLIANGTNVNAISESYADVKYTPLMAAANRGHADVVKVLLENGAEVNATDFQGWTALYYAFWIFPDEDNEENHRERAELVKALIASGADVNKQCQGISPLINAISTGTPRLGSIEALLDAGANIHFKDNRGLTPLYWAAFTGNKDVLDLILERGDYSDTIHLSACREDLTRVQTFLEEGMDVNTKDEFGCTPLHWAVLGESSDVAKLLISKGADVNAKDARNFTPLLAARRLPVIELLISKGADISAQEGLQESTKLHNACSNGDIKVVEFLIDKGADINARNRRGATPLWIAASGDQKEIVELLLEKGADINATDRRRQCTPLWIAVRNGNKDNVELLIEKGANIHTPDNQGQTPLAIAQQRGHIEIVELLKKLGAKE
jgi:ankyrin repeat protein/beta-lactamase regulating signal transducer with metallopeptidase domain